MHAIDVVHEDDDDKQRKRMKEQMTELYNNATLLFDTWQSDMNVTKDSMKGYWRGQDEDWVADAREAGELLSQITILFYILKYACVTIGKY